MQPAAYATTAVASPRLSRNGIFCAATPIAPRSVTAGRNKSIKNEGKQGGWVMGLNQRVH